MSVQVIQGDIFQSQCQTLVNPINCVGVMGAGLALEYRKRYPQMYERYQAFCRQGDLKIGKLWIYKSSDRWILNFPTKNHWQYPSKIAYLQVGLEKFINTYQQRKITSIAFPLLGASCGRINPATSLEVMQNYLEQCYIPVEIYCYQPIREE